MQDLEGPIRAKAEHVRTRFGALLGKTNKENPQFKDVKALSNLLSERDEAERFVRKKMLQSTANNGAKIKNENSAIKMLPGFIARVSVRCGKSNCRCSRGARHSAYYHVTYSSGTRIRQYVRRNQVDETRAACEAHRSLQRKLRAGRAEYKEWLAQTRRLVKLLSE